MFGQFFQAGLASEYSAQNWPVLEMRSSTQYQICGETCTLNLQKRYAAIRL